MVEVIYKEVQFIVLVP